MSKFFTIIFLTLLINNAASAQIGKADAIYSGVPWFDDHGKPVSAHGANIIKANGKYYLYGEAHSDTSNNFNGFNCYSSTDLYNWKFETVALPVQAGGRLGINRVGERPKVLYCPKTGEYIMLMHTDSTTYKDPCIGYATAKTPVGPYTFRGPILFDGKPIKKWDMGTFQDRDGSAYLLIHGGTFYKLADDYRSIAELTVKDISPACESPAVFKKGNLYYFLASSRTSWERNDNFYYTARSLKGPWTSRGNFAPKGSLTWDSQTTFVFPIEGPRDTTYLYMGDRWSFPRQASSATYVWQPLTINGESLTIPQYQQALQINTQTGTTSVKPIAQKTIKSYDKQLTYTGNWHYNIADSLSITESDSKGATLTIKANTTQMALYCYATTQSGYANITLHDSKGRTILTSTIDTYSKAPGSTLKFITPVLPLDNYTLTVTVVGEHCSWSDKSLTKYGSSGNGVGVERIVVRE